MACKIYSLKSVIELFDTVEGSKETFLESLSNFTCKHSNHELEYFLKNQAIEFEKRNLARTYLAYIDNPSDIVGYFTIAIKSVDLNGTSRKTKKTVASDDTVLTAPAFLLAHIGKSPNGNLEKFELLNHAISYIKSAQEIVGGRAIYIDCDINNSHLLHYYSSRGFSVMSEGAKYRQMIMKL